MINQKKMFHKNRMIWPLLAALTGYCSCASMGTPTGGPKDETPPVLISSTPPVNTVNYKKKKIEIYFDELISVKNASEKVIISPPQKEVPTISGIMKKVVVELQDSLKSNETYTIDFTNSIVDYNEGNPYGDYAFAFSTGPTIDTMCVSGHVLNASDLTPQKGVLVGVHSDLSDSIFIKGPFLRISKTDDNGFFCIKNLKNVPYKVYALGDQNRDYKFDQKGESIAFPDSAVTLWTEICQRYDTVWQDTTTIDTVYVRDVTCFKPDDIVLKYFQEDFGRQYLVKTERPEKNKLAVYFGYKSDTLPHLTIFAPDSLPQEDTWYVLEENYTRDTLIYWLKDTLLAKMDTLTVQIDYLKTDSLNQLVSTNDTLRFVAPKEKVGKGSKRNKKQDTKRNAETPSAANDSTPPKPVAHLKIDAKISPSMDVYEVPCLIWETPLSEIKGYPWHLYKKIDTLWTETSDFEIEADYYRVRRHNMYADWEYEGEYKLEIDSGMIVGMYGLTNNKLTQTFKIKSAKDYSRLKVTVEGLDGIPAYLEVVNKSDKIVRKEEVVDGVADCLNMKPGDYYMRVILDENDNFKWDTGNYDEKRQPEQVFYNSKLINLKANWEVNETWNIWRTPIIKQKPKELLPTSKKK